MRNLSTALLIIFILLLPILIWAEHTNMKAWQNRLAIPLFEPEPDRHAPTHNTGTILPPVIDKDLTLTPNNNPILLTGTTHLNANTTLTLTPGTTIYANEFSSIIVAGQLIVQGDDSLPVLFTSNETHPLNQTWGGIIVTADGQATITQANIHHASPSLTCLSDSHATLTNSHLLDTALGVFTASPFCHINNSRINSIRDGIVAIDIDPAITNTKIFAGRQDIVKSPK